MVLHGQELSVPGCSDSHFHASGIQERTGNLNAVLDACEAAGMIHALDIGTHPGDLEARKLLVKTRPWILQSSGLYPEHAAFDCSLAIALLEKQAASGELVAIGEFGLDYYHFPQTKSAQADLVSSQLHLCKQYRLPAVLHVRDAHDDLITLLEPWKGHVRGVIHCCTANPEQARRYLDLGFFLSFAGNLSYKNNQVGRDTLRIVPNDRLLFETDAPWLTPVPFRGKDCFPFHVGATIRLAAEIKALDAEVLARTTSETFGRLFIDRER